MFLKRKILLCFMVLLFSTIAGGIAGAETEILNSAMLSRKTENVYKKEYSFSSSEIDYKLLRGGTFTMLGGSVLAAGLLYVLPESFTNWDRSEIKNIFKK